METKLFIFLLAVSACNAGIDLGNIISAAHSTFHNVAGDIIDGIAHGLNMNEDKNAKRGPEETIIVVVDEGNPNEYRRPSGNNWPHQNQHRPPFNNNGGYNQGHNQPGKPHHQGNEHFNGNYNNYNQGYPNNYGHPQNGNNPNRYPNYPNQGHNMNYGRPQYPQQYYGNNVNYHNNGNYNYGYKPRPNPGNNYNGIPNQPNSMWFNNNQQQNNQNNNDKYVNNDNNDNNGGGIPNLITKPTPEFTTKQPGFTVKPSVTTKIPDSDNPLFVPLLPEENNGGTDVTAPKRETNKDKDDEEDFELDVRIKE